MNILVLGGSGFIGNALIFALCGDHQVTSVQRHPYYFKYPDLAVREILADVSQLSVSDFESLLTDVDCVIHLVSTTVPGNSSQNVEADLVDNVASVIRLLEAGRGKENIKMIYASSGGTVYGDVLIKEPMDECRSLNPISPYGIHKVTAEHYLRFYKLHYGINSLVLRFANPYGVTTSKKEQGVIPIFLNKIFKNENITCFGLADNVRDYIYIDDVVESVIQAIKYNGDKTVFNIGTGIGTTLSEVIAMLEEETGKKADISYEASRGVDVSYNVLCSDLALKELQWKAKIGLSDGIRKMIQFCRKED